MDIRQATIKDLNIILDFMGPKHVRRNDWHVSIKNALKSFITEETKFYFICVINNKVTGSLTGEVKQNNNMAFIGEIKAKGQQSDVAINKMYGKLIKLCSKNKLSLIVAYTDQPKITEIYEKLGMKKVGDNLYEKRL